MEFKISCPVNSNVSQCWRQSIRAGIRQLPLLTDCIEPAANIYIREQNQRSEVDLIVQGYNVLHGGKKKIIKNLFNLKINIQKCAFNNKTRFFNKYA